MPQLTIFRTRFCPLFTFLTHVSAFLPKRGKDLNTTFLHTLLMTACFGATKIERTTFPGTLWHGGILDTCWEQILTRFWV